MKQLPNFDIVEDTESRLIIRDLGPWNRHLTVTNGAEAIVAKLAEHLGDRRLFYFDSDGHLDEIIHKDGAFVGFLSGRSTGMERTLGTRCFRNKPAEECRACVTRSQCNSKRNNQR